MPRIRTNIEIEEAYVRRIMDRFGVHTKTKAVDLALRHLAGQPMTREEALAMEGLTPSSTLRLMWARVIADRLEYGYRAPS